MGFSHATVDVPADKAVQLCTAGPDGTLVKNLGGSRVFVGGPGVAADGDGAGFPLEPGEAQTFTAPEPRMSFSVPAPEGDMAPAELFARAATGTCKVAWIAGG